MSPLSNVHLSEIFWHFNFNIVRANKDFFFFDWTANAGTSVCQPDTVQGPVLLDSQISLLTVPKWQWTPSCITSTCLCFCNLSALLGHGCCQPYSPIETSPLVAWEHRTNLEIWWPLLLPNGGALKASAPATSCSSVPSISTNLIYYTVWSQMRPSLKSPNPHVNALHYEHPYCLQFEFRLENKHFTIAFCSSSYDLNIYQLLHCSRHYSFQQHFACFSSFPQRDSKTDLSLLSDLYSPLSLYKVTKKLLCFPCF